MNIGIDSLVEEIICIELEAEGIDSKVIDRIIESIHYNCKETNFMYNSVADTNYYAAEERKENQKLIDAKKELEKAEKEHQEKMDEMIREARWRYQRYQQRIEELEKQIR